MRTGGWLSGATILALTLVACDGDKTWGAGPAPVNGGGHHGGGTGGTQADADVPPIGGDAGSADKITGTVCDVADVRSPGACTAVARAGLIVGLEKTTGQPIATAMTVAGGGFTLAKPVEDTVWLTVSDPMHVYHFGAQVLPILVQGTNGLRAPVIKDDYYNDIHAGSQVVPQGGNGLVFLHLEHGDTPLADAVIGPFHGATAYYDRMGDAIHFSEQTPTTSSGFAVWFNVPPSVGDRYNVTVGDVITQHVGAAYADAVTFLSDVN
jgi:hypothetical protein